MWVGGWVGVVFVHACVCVAHPHQNLVGKWVCNVTSSVNYKVPFKAQGEVIACSLHTHVHTHGESGLVW